MPFFRSVAKTKHVKNYVPQMCVIGNMNEEQDSPGMKPMIQE